MYWYCLRKGFEMTITKYAVQFEWDFNFTRQRFQGTQTPMLGAQEEKNWKEIDTNKKKQLLKTRTFFCKFRKKNIMQALFWCKTLSYQKRF